MPFESVTELGKIVWTEEVIATLAGATATECPGVVGMVGRGVTDGLAELMGRDTLSKGVDVVEQGGKAQITLNIVVGYGVRIPEVARQAGQMVREAVTRDTGVEVARVRVHVQGLSKEPQSTRQEG